MKKAYWNLAIDASAALLFLGMLATGFILRFPLPPGTQRSLILWGLSRHEWGTVHTWISFGLIAVLLLHLAMHWQWITAMVKKRIVRNKGAGSARDSRAWQSGLLAALVLIAAGSVFAWATFRSVKGDDTAREPQRLQLRIHGGSPAGALPVAPPPDADSDSSSTSAH